MGAGAKQGKVSVAFNLEIANGSAVARTTFSPFQVINKAKRIAGKPATVLCRCKVRVLHAVGRGQLEFV